MKVTCIDIYDKDGNLTKIEIVNEAGETVLTAPWDPTDEQTSKNREEFRNWVYKHLKRKNFEL
jgi:hypothetical protein